jgi:hypothetical protein
VAPCAPAFRSCGFHAPPPARLLLEPAHDERIAMNDVKYYPAYLLNEQEYDNAEACLDARGCSEEQAQNFISLAKTRQSEIILHAGEATPDEFFLVIAEDEGKWRTWAARANAIRDTREKAEELMETFGKDVEWRIFDVRDAALGS